MVSGRAERAYEVLRSNGYPILNSFSNWIELQPHHKEDALALLRRHDILPRHTEPRTLEYSSKPVVRFVFH